MAGSEWFRWRGHVSLVAAAVGTCLGLVVAEAATVKPGRRLQTPDTGRLSCTGLSVGVKAVRWLLNRC